MLNTLGMKLYFSENDNNINDDDYNCQTNKTLNIRNIAEMSLSEKSQSGVRN